MSEIVSVVIPTLNSSQTLAECLASVRANDGKYDYEVIVVDAMSKDDTIDIAKRNADRVIVEENCPIGKSRNLGIKSAKGNIICFTDSDCVVPENWIDTLVDNLLRLNKQDNKIVGVGGGNIPLLENPSPVELAISKTIRSPLVAFGARNVTVYKKGRQVWHNPPVNSAYFKWALEEVNGFGERHGHSEDLELDVKIAEKGYKLYYIPDLLVYHKHKSSLQGYARQMQDWGRKRIRLMRDYPHISGLYHYGPLFLYLMLFSPLFFIPLAMALTNATYLAFKERSLRLFGYAFSLTLSFYRNFGQGEAEILFNREKSEDISA